MTQHSPRRRALGLISAVGAAALLLASCGGADNGEDTAADDAEQTETDDGQAGDDGEAGDLEEISIGISQYVQHAALDAATEGFKQAILDAGYVEGETVTFDEQNAAAEVATASTIAQGFANSDLDLVLAVATPSAEAAAQNITDTPIVFTAVTEPVEAGLVDSNEEPGANMTGTSDINPVADQIELITEIVPDASSIGIVYSSGEVNSEVQVNLAKEKAEELGIEIVEATVSNSSEIQQSTESLGDVDAIYVPTDNDVVAGLSALINVAEDKGIAVIGAEAGTVEGGAIATLGIDYTELGYQTGEMALRILDGEDPATMPVETQNEYQLIVNPDAAERMGVTLPDGFVDEADEILETVEEDNED